MAARSTFHVFLAGVDDDGLADHALVAAEQVRSLREGKLDLMYALRRRPRERREEVELVLGTVELLSKRLAAVEARNGLAKGALSDRLKVVFGEPGEVLVGKAADGPADAVFLGPQSKKGLLGPGSTVSAVLEGTSCCVWLQPCPVVPFERILLAFDGSPASVHALDLAQRVAANMGGRVTVLHCLEGPRDAALRQIEGHLTEVDWSGVGHELEIVAEKPEQGVLSRQASFDLIVLGTRGHKGLKRALLGSLAHDVARDAEKPVLIVPRPNL